MLDCPHGAMKEVFSRVDLNVFMSNTTTGVISREYGKVVDGKELTGQWAYRPVAGAGIRDFDWFCNDLAERNNISLYHPQ